MRCKECGGELRPKADFFKQDGPEKYEEIKKKFKKEFGTDLPEPTGYNCIKCGACYDNNYKREEINLGWLK
jgi:hypothetical protein